MNIESSILSSLIHNENFLRKVIPFLKSNYFHNKSEITVFNLIDKYVNKYNTLPTKEALYIDLSNTKNIEERDFEQCKSLISSLEKTATDIEWLLEKTEKFCQDRAIYNGIMESIKILDDKSGKLDTGSIPTILSDALAVSFDTNVGHNYLEDAEYRFDFYNRKESKISFDIDILNRITDGGVTRKTLNVLMAGTGSGKSLIMCHFAKADLMAGRNVLYITLEMSEEKISERIDANILDIEVKKIRGLKKADYLSKIDRIKKSTGGKLVVKEYPTSTAGANHFRFLLNELAVKQNFKPDVIYIDYLNLCCSSRMKVGGSVNSYSYIKAIAEELRGLAGEYDVPVWSATQLNRSGINASDISMTDTSESIGLPMTCDLFLGVVSTDELKQEKQLMFKQLKNRYGDVSDYNKFLVGVDYSKMRLNNISDPEQGLIKDDTPIMDANFLEEKIKKNFSKKESLKALK